MIKLTREYLSILQCLLYKAQKRQKIKQILKFQKIFYKSKSLLYFVLRYQKLKTFKRNKMQNFVSESIFQKYVKIFILKKQIQISFFFYSKLQSKKNLIHFIENVHNLSSFTFFFNKKKKQIISINFFFCHHTMKLSYLSLYNNSINLHLNSLITIKLDLFILLTLLLSNQIFLLFYVHKINIYILRKTSKKITLKIGTKYPLFNYKTFYDFYFYHHNYFVDSEKIKYQNIFYFRLLSAKKQKFGNQQKKEKIKKNFLNYKNLIYKNNYPYYFSTILNNPFFRQNACFFSSQLCNNFFFKYFNKIKFLEIQLKHIQKQLLLVIFEPIWEASFEIYSYSNRKGRSLYDAIEFIRFYFKKQPIFVFKIYFKFFYKILYQNREKKRYFKNTYNFFYFLQKKRRSFDNLHFIYNKLKRFSLFFNFIENIFFYGIQQKKQNYYLRTKQQLFLYQTLKIFKQNNKKMDISFYKIFYNRYFYFLTIQNKIQFKIENKKVRTPFFIKKLIKNEKSIRNCRKFIMFFFKNFDFYKYKNRLNNFKSKQFINLRSENFFIHNFLIFSLSNLFFEKINNVKQKLFSSQFNKQKFSFNLQKLISSFFSLNNNFSKRKGISFSIIYKDSNFFVSKNTFLFFFIKKNKKVFSNLLNYWTKENNCFFKKIKNNIILLKKLQYQLTPIKKLKNIFIFSTTILPAGRNFKILLKIKIFFNCGFFNSLNQYLNFDSFHNLSLIFLLFIKNIFFSSNLLKKSCSFLNFYFMMYSCNFYGKFFSIFRSNFKIDFIIFLLEKNDVKIIWKIFIKYENHLLFFNSNLNFLKSFQIILKKWMIFNKIILFLDIGNKFNLLPCFYIIKNYKAYNHNDWILFYLKNKINGEFLKNFYLKNKIKKVKTLKKEYSINTLWSIKFFFTKEKHTFLLYKKNVNGFTFFNFFIFHKKKKSKNCILNFLFFWQFYFVKTLKHFKYLQSFRNKDQIYQIHLKVCDKLYRFKNKQIKQKIKFYFFQSLFLQSNPSIISQCIYFLKKLRIFSFKIQIKSNSFYLLNLFFFQVKKEESKLILYKKLIQQQTVKLSFSFSIKPLKYNIQRHLLQIQNIVKKSLNQKQYHLIFQLSKIIKNWCFYYQIITPTIIFKYVDYLTLQILWRWACKRHYQKSKKWIKMKYFHKLKFLITILNKKKFLVKNTVYQNSNKINKIVFASQIKLLKKNNIYIYFNNFNKKDIYYDFPTKDWIKYNLSNLNKISKKIFICLPNHTDVILIKHKLIQNDRSPFDGDFLYWISRNFYD